MSDRNLDYDYASKQKMSTEEHYGRKQQIEAGYEGNRTPPLIWNVEGEATGSAPTNVYDPYGENVVVRDIPVDPTNPRSSFTREVVCDTGNPDFYYGMFMVFKAESLNLDLATARFRVEVVASLDASIMDSWSGVVAIVGQDPWYSPPDTPYLTVSSSYYDNEDDLTRQSWVFRYLEDGEFAYNSVDTNSIINWEHGNPQIGYCLYQFEADMLANIFKLRIVGFWDGDQGHQVGWWNEVPSSSFINTHAYEQGSVVPHVEFAVVSDIVAQEKAKITQVWVGGIFDDFPNGEVLESNYALGIGEEG